VKEKMNFSLFLLLQQGSDTQPLFERDACGRVSYQVELTSLGLECTFCFLSWKEWLETSTTHCGGSVASSIVSQSLHLDFLARMLEWLNRHDSQGYCCVLSWLMSLVEITRYHNPDYLLTQWSRILLEMLTGL
jgi:hypothetical protein